MSSSSAGNSSQNGTNVLAEFFRCPSAIGTFEAPGDLSDKSGYFRFGKDIVCYGQCSSADPAPSANGPLHDASEHVLTGNSTVQLPFNPEQVVDNLRRERYVPNAGQDAGNLPCNRALRAIYYSLRPHMSLWVRKKLQRLYFRGREKASFPKWPVDTTVESVFEELLVLAMQSHKLERVPFIWFWPLGARSCTTITHDVESSAGWNFVPQLMNLDDSFGLKTSFQIVPESRYNVSEAMLEMVRARGFEINVHDLNHDGQLFSDRKQFLPRAARINQYARQFGAVGFRSAAMYRNMDWFDTLDFSYDMSVPNVAHLDPQSGGCCTVFPFFVGKMVELPVTTTQDYSLFYLLKNYSTRLWREQISRIRDKHGLISVIVHPDYIIEKKARDVYRELLQYLWELRSLGETWIALPGEVASWWRLRSEMKLVPGRDGWRIEGEGSENASLAYAVLKSDNRLAYELADTACDVGSTAAAVSF